MPALRVQIPQVFALYDLDRSGQLTLEEIDENAHAMVQRGDIEKKLDRDERVTEKSNAEKSFLERQKTEASKRAEAVGKERKEQVDAADKAKKAANAGAATPEEFKAVVLRRYGNLYRAWRMMMAEDFVFCNFYSNLWLIFGKL